MGPGFARTRHPKRLLAAALALALTGALASRPDGVQAAVTSRVCADCHTMHNSQNGQPVAQEWDPDQQKMLLGTGANPALTLYGGCVACHTNTTSSATLGANGAPIVFNTTQEPSQMLAGGNFHWMAQGGMDSDGIENFKKGHNVATLRGGDPLTAPPGGTMTGTLACAGQSGCHGNPAIADEFEAIRGSHHSDDGSIDGTTVAKSYRFLGVSGYGGFQGVVGVEDDDWERVPTSTDHNEYKGAPEATDSISALCSRCHTAIGDPNVFGPDSPHYRHPADVVLPDEGEYASYTTYNPLVPVARQTPLAFTSDAQHAAVVAGSDCVMCLSCHRAHGSSYWKLLRWNYPRDYSPPEGGCATCHTYKD